MPLTDQYNHHHNAIIFGAHATLIGIFYGAAQPLLRMAQVREREREGPRACPGAALARSRRAHACADR